jgi:hypothetical protein
MAGPVAFVTLTGSNHNVRLDGTESTSQWRWTMALERTGQSTWVIGHEHLSVKDP